ncbi:MAG: polysaccharide biosynthesis/export family protein [Bacteroidaceae bacterium]|nr:polysaccharide biosynthesis/export family protein [Bacteroidaceae bacterium]
MRTRFNVCIMLFVVLLTSCNSYKQIPYLIDADTFKTSATSELYDARIMPKDLLSITVISTNPEASVPFNLTVPTIQNVSMKLVTTSQPVLQSYLVDNTGCVNFPVLGKLKLAGLTKNQAEDFITKKLATSFKELPIVTVRLINYKVSVIGEVKRPGTFSVANEKINVFEALALAGDMTVYGMRNNVKLIREDQSGAKQIIKLDFNKAEIVNSPYFYLQQNDVLYVEPNKSKAKNSDIGQSTTLWFSATSIVISLTSLLYNILN